MTLQKLADDLDLDCEDLIEVLMQMGHLKKDYSDWTDEIYDRGLVKSLDNICKPSVIKQDLQEYKDCLYQLVYSRQAKNEFDTVKLLLKDRILSNNSLVNFAKS